MTENDERCKAVKDQPTSLSTALKRPLLVFVVDLWAEAFLNPPYLVSVLLLMVSAFSLGASPSITKTSFTPISVRDDTLKNKFLDTKRHHLWVICDHQTYSRVRVRRLGFNLISKEFVTKKCDNYLKWGLVTLPIIAWTCWASHTHKLRSTASVFPLKLYRGTDSRTGSTIDHKSWTPITPPKWVWTDLTWGTTTLIMLHCTTQHKTTTTSFQTVAPLGHVPISLTSLYYAALLRY